MIGATARPRFTRSGLGLTLVIALTVSACVNPSDPTPSDAGVVVQRGTLIDHLEELGELSPREPLRVVVRIKGKLQWVIEDNTWVEPGDEIFILDDDQALQEVAELRNQLLQATQEWRLAKLEREHAERTEGIALRAAERKAELERIRHRVLTADPEGGDALLRLDRELAPLEEVAEDRRATYERAFAAYQQAESRFLDALEAWQRNRDEQLSLQSRIDELAITAERDPSTLTEVEREDRAQAVQRLDELREQLATVEASEVELAQAVDQARTRRDATLEPRDRARAELEAAEAAMRDLQVAIEIEKRALPLTYLQLDRQAAELRLAAAHRDLDQGRQAFEAGAISRQRLDELEQALADEQDQLAILDQQIAIESEPASAEELAQSEAELELAELQAANAQAGYERALALRDQDIAVAKAKMEKLEHQIAEQAGVFPKVIEASIEFAQRELRLLQDEERDRREELRTEITELQRRLAEAKANPPNVARAPAAGIVRIRRQGDRPKQPGDEVHEGDTMAEIFPSQDMDVALAINENDVDALETGMPAVVTIPALDDRRFEGQLDHISRIGRDKFHHLADEGMHAGVTEFEGRILLERTDPDFRQGMSAMVVLERERLEDVTYVPRSAVAWTDDGRPWVLLDGTDGPARRQIEGRLFGTGWFVVESGLDPGERILDRPEGRS